MATEKDSRYSRAPRLEDLLSLCEALNKENAQYMVIGGFAMILHGYIRATADIDLLVDPSAVNIQKIKKAMSGLPDNAAAEISETDVENYQVVRIADEFVVDLLAKACGVGYPEAAPKKIVAGIHGVEIPYPDAALMIQMKQTPRPKDQQDILFLKYKLNEQKKGGE